MGTENSRIFQKLMQSLLGFYSQIPSASLNLFIYVFFFFLLLIYLLIFKVFTSSFI